MQDIELNSSVDAALTGADVAVIATPWPEFRELDTDRFIRVMRRAQVVDASGALAHLAASPDVVYARVGVAPRRAALA